MQNKTVWIPLDQHVLQVAPAEGTFLGSLEQILFGIDATISIH